MASTSFKLLLSSNGVTIINDFVVFLNSHQIRRLLHVRRFGRRRYNRYCGWYRDRRKGRRTTPRRFTRKKNDNNWGTSFELVEIRLDWKKILLTLPTSFIRQKTMIWWNAHRNEMIIVVGLDQIKTNPSWYSISRYQGQNFQQSRSLTCVTTYLSTYLRVRIRFMFSRFDFISRTPDI